MQTREHINCCHRAVHCFRKYHTALTSTYSHSNFGRRHIIALVACPALHAGWLQAFLLECCCIFTSLSPELVHEEAHWTRCCAHVAIVLLEPLQPPDRTIAVTTMLSPELIYQATA
jgi:hypothetical protein